MNAINRNFEINTAMEDRYAALSAPDTLTLRRRLPGPVDRVWAYLTESELRRRWLASGEMVPKVGARFELTWKNDELTAPPGRRPDGFPGTHTSEHEIMAIEPDHRLVFSFGAFGEVTFEIEPHGSEVLLTLVHRGLNDRASLGFIGPSWHNHLDLLVARLANVDPGEAYWDKMTRLLGEYELRLPRSEPASKSSNA